MASNSQPTKAIFALMTRKSGVSFDYFKDYYENKHIPWVNELIGGDKYIAQWTRNYFQRSQDDDTKSLEGYGDGTAGTWDFDAITQIVPKDQKAFDEMWAKFGEVGEAIAKDEMNFCDREKSKIYFVADQQHGVAK